MTSGMEEIEHRDSRVGKTSAIDAPQAGSPITEPNHFWGGLPGLLGGFQLEVGDKLVDIAQYGDQSTVQQLGDNWSGLLSQISFLTSAMILVLSSLASSFWLFEPRGETVTTILLTLYARELGDCCVSSPLKTR